jgi:hypothetical protein
MTFEIANPIGRAVEGVGLLLAGIAGSNPAGGMDAFVF